MRIEWHDVVGIAGAATIVVTYLLLQLQRISSHHLPYSILNAVGAFLILVSLAVQFNFSAFLIEAFWLAISLYGIWRWRRARSSE